MFVPEHWKFFVYILDHLRSEILQVFQGVFGLYQVLGQVLRDLRSVMWRSSKTHTLTHVAHVIHVCVFHSPNKASLEDHYPELARDVMELLWAPVQDVEGIFIFPERPSQVV